MSPAYHQKIVTIELPNNGQGFGFSIVSNGANGTVVHSILEGGIADVVRVIIDFMWVCSTWVCSTWVYFLWVWFILVSYNSFYKVNHNN